MSGRSVHWSEGLFLRPHHFQAADQAHAEQALRHTALNQPYYWGLSACTLDAEALSAFRFVVRKLRLRFRDGTIVDLPDDAPLADLDLKPLFVGRSRLQIFLGLAKRRATGANLIGADSPQGRYRIETSAVPDENTGGNPQPLTFRIPGVRLLTEDDDAAGYDRLPLMILEKSERAEAVPKPTVEFIPPLTACEAWPGLQVELLQKLYYRINKKMEVLSAQVLSRGIGWDSQSPGDLRRLLQLDRLNQGYAALSHTAFVPGVHPAEAYRELLRLVGSLAIFSKAVRTEELPRYDHDDLGNGFWKLKTTLDTFLNEVDEPAYEEAPFIGTGLRMQVALKPQWLESGMAMYLGVRSNISTEECVKLLTRPERLGMKIGSWDRVEDIFSKGQPGLRFTATPYPPRELPSAPNLTYFEISRESAGNEWAFVLKGKTLAVRIHERDIVGAIDGKQELSIRTGGQTTTFWFTLYVVPAAK